MDSPQGHRIIIAAAAPPSPAQSPAVQESPFLNFANKLSPLKSCKAAKYAARFVESDLPIPQPVFTSPHIDLQRGTVFLKREENDSAGTEIHGLSDRQLKNVLTPSFQNEVQTCSPTVCVDEFLADAADLEDCKNSVNVHGQPTAPQMSESCFTGPEAAFKTGTDANGDNTKAAVKTSSVQDEGNLTASSTHMVRSTVIQNNDEKFGKFLELTSENVNTHIKSVLFQDPVSGADYHEDNDVQVFQDVEFQNEDGQHNKSDASCAEGSRQESKESVEDNQHQRGIRRHLQFGVVALKRATTAELSAGCSNLESPSISAFPPSGIRLHMGSIARPMIMGPEMIASKEFPAYLCSEDKQIMPERSNELNSAPISAVASETYIHMEDDQPGSQAVLPISSDPSHSSKMTLFEQQVARYEGRMLASEQADFFDDIDQVSPKRKRKKAVQFNESDGCKRCNCKRSKCLKLYCECFAAGVYCLDSCTCQNCFNKPEYEDTVQDTRQLIESRNPLAFAPKIVQQTTDSPANVVEDGDGTTPSSARHKRGCNCKKSKCLKKYCECYQINVGCSVGCRCEGCHNPYGKKPGLIYQRAKRWRNSSNEKLDSPETVMDCIKTSSTNQFSPALEGTADIDRLTPLSHPHQSAGASSTSSNLRDCSKVASAQSQSQSTRQLSTGHLEWVPMRLTPQLCERRTPNELSSDGSLFDILSFDDIPEPLTDSSTPTKALKTSSPNQKRVSPPQFRLKESSSSSPPGLRSSHKFGRTVPSFPPLTPYSNSKAGISQKRNDHLGNSNTSDQYADNQ